MENQKIENILNMSMDVTDSQREKSIELSEGYDTNSKSWEIIIKYSGDIETIAQDTGMTFAVLMNKYAISRGTKEQIEHLSSQPGVEYMEKPKALLYSVTEGIRASCIYQLQPPAGNLTGKGTLIGIIDSGIDLFHPDFIKEDGTSRIIGLWDQTADVSGRQTDGEVSDNADKMDFGQIPKPYGGGFFYSREEINQALALGKEEGSRLIPAKDPSGHGTHVAGIAAGNGRASGGRKRGVAPEADILVVKLGSPASGDFPRTTQLMTGADFAVRVALQRNQPLALNLSFGNNYGAHGGDSLLETYLGSLMGLGRLVIVAGTGNEGTNARHTQGTLQQGKEKRIQFVVGPYESGFGLQIWKNYVDQYDIILEHPSGERIGPLQNRLGLTEFQIQQTQMLIYFGEPSPYSTTQEIYLSFLPVNDYVDSGIWSVFLIPRKVVTGFYAMWLPDSGLTSAVTRFLQPKVTTTLTIPSTAQRLISVGAYDAYTDSMAPFSGRGYTIENLVKPDLVAPGVNIESCVPGGGYGIKSGTSMAAPFVTGSAALMMEWGIIKGNDPYLYGEKVKAYLRSGAKPLPGFSVYPNPQTGYGALCVRDSLPF